MLPLKIAILLIFSGKRLKFIVCHILWLRWSKPFNCKFISTLFFSLTLLFFIFRISFEAINFFKVSVSMLWHTGQAELFLMKLACPFN